MRIGDRVIHEYIELGEQFSNGFVAYLCVLPQWIIRNNHWQPIFADAIIPTALIEQYVNPLEAPIAHRFVMTEIRAEQTAQEGGPA